jgi:cytosine/creatinine deaminase
MSEGGGLLLLKNARIHGMPETQDILIKDGLIDCIGGMEGSGVDLAGRLITPGFVNIHTHLDKADLISYMGPSDFGKTLEENRELLKKFKSQYTVENIIERATPVLYELMANGVTALRTQADIDSTCSLKALEAMIELKKQSPINIQVCAFPQEGLMGEKQGGQMEAAIETGADLLGGLPLIEETPEEQVKHLDILFELAVKHDVGLDIQLDESNSPQDFLLPILAEKTIENRMEGKVAATHCISLSKVPAEVAAQTINLVKQAEINVNVTPGANLITRFPQPGDTHPRGYNSITLVKELIDAGVNVAVGTDNIRDIFFPYGNCSMIRETYLLAMATRMTRAKDPENLFKMASVNGAKTMGLNYGLIPGAKADLNVFYATDYLKAINSPEKIAYVIKDGRIICKDGVKTQSG